MNQLSLKNLIFLNFIFVFFTSSAQQPGSFDNSFQIGTGTNALVTAITIQSDNRILIGGGFNNYKGVSRRKITRILPNGSNDFTFNSGISFDGQDSLVLSIKLQNDSSIIVGGSFNSYQGIPINNITRLKTNGDLDTSFHSGIGADERVIDIALQADGKIILGGYFNTYDGVSSNGIIRLNPNGTIDTSFHTGNGTGTGVHTGVHKIRIQDDGKILIVGLFDSYNQNPRNYIARLNADGTIDPSFNPGINIIGGNVNSCAIQSDGKILIGGSFHHYGTSIAAGIMRLNQDGTLDNSFDSNPGVVAGSLPYLNVDEIGLQEDGRIIISGYFMSYNGVLRNNITRINSDGSIDLTFNVGNGLNGYANSLYLQNDGKVLIGGQFQTYNQQNAPHIVRLNGGTDFANISQSDVKNSILIYPNPASSFIQISNIPETAIIQLIDLNGRLIFEVLAGQNPFLDISNLRNGFYSITIQLTDQTKSQHKLLIQH